MKYFLIKLAGKTDQDAGKPWAIYEYDVTFENKVKEAPYIVSEICCTNGVHSHKLGNAYYVAATGTIELDAYGKAWIR